ncbi:MAG: cupredoxin domain-containing protein [Anaerolineales bacterium]
MTLQKLMRSPWLWFLAGLLLSACTSAAVVATGTPSSVASEVPSTSLPATEQPAAPPSTAEAKIQLFAFKPGSLEVPAGTTVTWTNMDAIEHSVTHGAPPEAGGKFDSDFFTQGQTFNFTFTEPGKYTYFCKRHNSMTGTVTVVPAP